jgi:peptidyl-tRNA hydrolase
MADQIVAEDPIVLYVIVNYDLNMSSGKIAAQCMHLMEKFAMHYVKLLALSTKKDVNIVPDHDMEHVKLTTEWMINGHSTKVVLKANEEEWAMLKEEFGKGLFIVHDAGRTEVKPHAETVSGLWPMRKSTASKIIQRLPSL